jgi:hypothetical protein
LPVIVIRLERQRDAGDRRAVHRHVCLPQHWSRLRRSRTGITIIGSAFPAGGATRTA